MILIKADKAYTFNILGDESYSANIDSGGTELPPYNVTAHAPVKHPARKEDLRSFPDLAHSTRNPPTNASPAPVLSTSF